MGSGGAAKGFEDRAAIGITLPVIFGVPLHTDCEAARAFNAHRFNRAIRCPAFRDQARRQALHCLIMQRIYRKLSRAARWCRAQ